MHLSKRERKKDKEPALTRHALSHRSDRAETLGGTLTRDPVPAVSEPKGVRKKIAAARRDDRKGANTYRVRARPGTGDPTPTRGLLLQLEPLFPYSSRTAPSLPLPCALSSPRLPAL